MAPVQTILIVEDNSDIAALEADLLTTPDREVIVVADGVEALAVLARVRVDLVILDLNMPRLSGQSVLDCLGASPALSHIPVLVVSGNLEGVRPSSQVVGLIQKPFEAQQLVAAVERSEWARATPSIHDPSGSNMDAGSL